MVWCLQNEAIAAFRNASAVAISVTYTDPCACCSAILGFGKFGVMQFGALASFAYLLQVLQVLISLYMFLKTDAHPSVLIIKDTISNFEFG